MTCPLKSHKGGRESTPSFRYYPDTDSWHCYGCGTGGRSAHACEFMAAMEGIDRVKAANRIADMFGLGTEIGVEGVDSQQADVPEQLEIMMDFSNAIRDFRNNHFGEDAEKFIDGICWVYDQHNLKRTPTNEALQRLVEYLKKRIISYDASDFTR